MSAVICRRIDFLLVPSPLLTALPEGRSSIDAPALLSGDERPGRTAAEAAAAIAL